MLKAGLASGDVLANARGSASAAPIIDAGVERPEPRPRRIDIPKQPTLDSTAAASTLKYSFRFKVANRDGLPKKSWPASLGRPRRGRADPAAEVTRAGSSVLPTVAAPDGER